MQIIRIAKGDELKATASLSNRTDEDFDEIDESVKEIIKEVRRDGDAALFRLNEKFGGPSKEKMPSLRVTEQEINEGYESVEKDIIEAYRIAAENIRSFHEKQKLESWSYEKGNGIRLGQLIRPISDVGITIPGGAAPLSSTVLMNLIPARIAGCKRVIMCTPPDENGKISPYILAAAKIAGVDEIYKVGGAQGIAAMAYGTESIRKVNKITGPGGAYVARAKKYVFGTVDIDMIAGPSEVCVIADGKARPDYLAADMLSQAEHDKLSSAILVTTSAEIAEKTAAEIDRQIKALPRYDIASASIENNSVIFVAEDLDSCFDIANEIAPEHLELAIDNAEAYLDKVLYAGAVLLGEYSSEPLGDYAAGPNHTLPTSGTAKFASPLGVYDFMTRTSLIKYTREDLEAVKDVIVKMSDSEALAAHGNAIKIRFGEL